MFQVQFITHFHGAIGYLDGAQLALEGGCRWIQLRMKDASDEEVEQVGRRLLSCCRGYGAKLIVDDRVDVALRIGADGVHLGKNDMPVADARLKAGEHFIIGGTANTFEDVQRLYRDGADYIGCGPLRFTETKQRLSPILGLDGYRRILAEMKEAQIRLPIVAIGGVTADDIADLQAIGLTGIALSGSVLRATDPIAEMRRIINLTL